MIKYIDLCKGRIELVTEDSNVVDIRELDMGKKVLVTIIFDKEEK